MEGYYQFWNYAERKGYSGTAVFTKKKPLSVTFGIEIEEPDKEGRVITLEFDDFYLVNCIYTEFKTRFDSVRVSVNLGRRYENI